MEKFKIQNPPLIFIFMILKKTMKIENIKKFGLNLKRNKKQHHKIYFYSYAIKLLK